MAGMTGTSVDYELIAKSWLTTADQGSPGISEENALARAQVYATLALAAATQERGRRS